jgi:hypothetical protein
LQAAKFPFDCFRDHSVSSINVKLTGSADISEIDNIGDQIFYSGLNSLLLFADKVGDRLTTLNLNNNLFKNAEIPLDDATTIGFSEDAGTAKLYVASAFGAMRAIDPNHFGTIVNFFVGTRNAPISVGGSGTYAYCSVIESPTNSSIRLFQNFGFGNELDRVSFLNSAATTPWMLFKSPTVDELFAIEANTERAQVMVYRTLNSNNLRNRQDYNGTRTNLVDANRFEFAPNGSFFVTGRQGNIYSRQFTLSKQLNSNANYNTFYVDNNLNIYAATNRRIDIYNAPNYNLTRSVACRVNPTKMFIIANKAYLFAPSVNKLGNTLLEKVAL